MPKTRRRGPKYEGGYKFNSTLPVWLVEDGKIRGTLHIQCPRCQGKAVVSEDKWINQPAAQFGPFLGRSCTYCFMTSRLPLKRMNQKTRQAYHKTERNNDERRR